MRYMYIKYTERRVFILTFMTWIISTAHAIIEKCFEWRNNLRYKD